MRRSRFLVVLVLAVLCGLGWAGSPASAAGMNLHRGSHGSQVRILETWLSRLYLLPKSQVDRRYRVATANAVRTFQRQMGRAATGRVNRSTWTLMAAEVRRRTAPAPAPLILGHRGARVPGITENSMEALRYAADKVDVLEFDLQLTADDHFVLMHDDTLDRTTSCTGPVAARTLEFLQASCLTDTGSGPIPTFAEAVQFAASVGKAIAPEVKDVANVIPDKVLAGFVQVLRANGLVARTYVQSFHPTVFPRLRALEGDLELVHLAGSSIEPSAVQASGADVAGLNLPGLTAATVAKFHDVGLPVWAWTAVNLTQLQLLRANRVEGVYTDIPAAARDMYY